MNDTRPLATGNGVFVFDQSHCRSCLRVRSVAVGARWSNLPNNALMVPLRNVRKRRLANPAMYV